MVLYSNFNRYGLPANFQAAVIEPRKKQSGKLRDVLNNLYKGLDGNGLSNNVEVCLFIALSLL